MTADDWDSGRKAFNKRLLEQGDGEACPVGFGVTGDDKGQFQLYLGDGQTWGLRVELPRTGKILGFIPKPVKVYNVAVDDIKVAVELLRLFFTDRLEVGRRLSDMKSADPVGVHLGNS